MSLFRKYLTKEDLSAVADAIGEAEKTTCGEIRVVVRHRRNWGEGKLSLHELALKEFHSLGMEKTKDRTGILILVLFSEKKFQIIADEGIHRLVEDGTWDEVALQLSVKFGEGKFRDGLSEAVRDVGFVLAKHFPRTDGDTNELSDEVIER